MMQHLTFQNLKWLLIIGIIILLAQLAYTKGYEYGTYLGNNLTEIVEENRAESIK